MRLSSGLQRNTWVRLRSLEGRDEAVAAERDAFAATRLLGRLLVQSGDSPASPEFAWEMALCDRDRLLAEVYSQHFGDQIEISTTCTVCEEPFELQFSLEALIGQLDEQRRGAGEPDERGVYTLADGRRFRLPTAADQREVLGLPTDEAARSLLRLCLVDGDEGAGVDSLEAAIERAGPVLDQDLPSTCPKCAHLQSVRFDIQDHLLAVLEQERIFLLREVHSLASAYGWSLDEILGLPRSDRRAYVSLVQASLRGRG